jgi:aryl-alcohol dehydrogenase-like predicted oxidoreductase
MLTYCDKITHVFIAGSWIQASLKRLDMDYVDLLYCHRPDTSTPVEETVRAMNWVIDHGYAFYWGTSEWSAQQITEAWEVANRLDMVGPSMEQPEYNMFSRSRVNPALLMSYRNSEPAFLLMERLIILAQNVTWRI